MTSCVVGTRKTERWSPGHVLESERAEVRGAHTLARWRFSEDYGISCGVIWESWLRLFVLSLMWDALSQTVVQDGGHDSRKAKVAET